uniref:Uncharacterized protein n=1 Tax=Rhizophora mucronata TaxID=61149 RepID=A0A2P2R532_RHIMU
MPHITQRVINLLNKQGIIKTYTNQTNAFCTTAFHEVHKLQGIESYLFVCW